MDATTMRAADSIEVESAPARHQASQRSSFCWSATASWSIKKNCPGECAGRRGYLRLVILSIL